MPTEDEIVNENVSEQQIETADLEDNKANDDAPEYMDLPSGEAFTPNSLLELTRKRNIRFVVLAGAVESGKTTLITSLYELFQEGSVSNYIFAGSKTLLAIERRCHDSRLDSGRSTAKSVRTKPVLEEDEYELLHLKVRDINCKSHPQDIIFTDISGELFKEMRDSLDECIRNGIFLRTDHFVLLLDGEKICDILQRNEVANDGILIIQRLLESKILGSHSYVDILFSKYDVIERELKNSSELQAFLGSVIAKFNTRFGKKFFSLRYVNIAARPEPTGGQVMKMGYGLDELFPFWIENHPYTRISRQGVEIKRNIVREIDRII